MAFEHIAGRMMGVTFALTLAVASQPGFAQSVPPFIKLPPGVISEFNADPAKFLDNYRSGGLPLSNEIKDLVLTDPTTLGSIINASKAVTSVQGAAIGGGLAEAARAIAASNPQLATQIQTQVLASAPTDVAAAYIAISNSPVTASTGGGGGGGGGAGGGDGGAVGGPIGSGNSNNGGSAAGSSGAANGSTFGGLNGFGSVPGGGTLAATTSSTSPVQ